MYNILVILDGDWLIGVSQIVFALNRFNIEPSHLHYRYHLLASKLMYAISFTYRVREVDKSITLC